MFNSASGAADPIELIPAGTLTKAVLVCREIKTSNNTGGHYLDIELRAVGGPHEGRVLWDIIMDPFDGKNSDGAKRMGFQSLTRILECVGVFKPEDPTSYERYNQSLDLREIVEDIDGQTVGIRVKVEPGQEPHGPKNRVGLWLTPNPNAGPAYKAWKELFEGAPAATAPAGFGNAAGSVQQNPAPAGAPAAGGSPEWLKSPQG